MHDVDMEKLRNPWVVAGSLPALLILAALDLTNRRGSTFRPGLEVRLGVAAVTWVLFCIVVLLAGRGRS
ncbi:MAG TPA: hypothetical protein VM030_05110 [Acidimicrobiales bacterium]|nr:hypothetical protein [Acidimicrobiales bacterium]